jgi:hypothetical protein
METRMIADISGICLQDWIHWQSGSLNRSRCLAYLTYGYDVPKSDLQYGSFSPDVSYVSVVPQLVKYFKGSAVVSVFLLWFSFSIFKLVIFRKTAKDGIYYFSTLFSKQQCYRRLCLIPT